MLGLFSIKSHTWRAEYGKIIKNAYLKNIYNYLLLPVFQKMIMFNFDEWFSMRFHENIHTIEIFNKLKFTKDQNFPEPFGWFFHFYNTFSTSILWRRWIDPGFIFIVNFWHKKLMFLITSSSKFSNKQGVLRNANFY